MNTKILLINLTGGIPLGLAYLSASIKTRPGRDVRIIDYGEEEGSFGNVLEHIRLERPDILGATVYTYRVRDVQRLFRAAKGIDPSILTVVGGPHPTALPGETVEDESIDVVVRGEGETTFRELVDCVENNQSYHHLDGIAFVRNGTVTVNRARGFIRDLDSLPFPSWEDLPIRTYKHPDYGHPRMNKTYFVNMLATRGCPFQCLFCGAQDMWGRKLRKHGPERIAQEMTMLHRDYGVHSVRFADSTFTIDRKWIMEFCKALQSLDIDVAWEANARAGTLDEEMLLEMKKAKCVSLNIGVESGDEGVLAINRKDQSLDEVRNAFRLLKNVGIFSWAFFMIGCPGETRESIGKTIDFARELDPDQVSVCAYATPYPGTEFYELAKKEMNIDAIPWDDFHHSRKIIYIPDGLAASDIEEGKRIFCERLRPHERHKGRNFETVGGIA